jgi:hypothetical protein
MKVETLISKISKSNTIESPNLCFSSKYSKLRSNLSPIPKRASNRLNSDESNLAELSSYFCDFGFDKEKSKIYSEKLVLQQRIESLKMLNGIHDQVKLLSILNLVMDRHDAQFIAQDISKTKGDNFTKLLQLQI